MKFVFTLETVLRFRKTEQELAEVALQMAMAQLHQQEETLKQLQQQVHTTHQFRFESQIQGGDVQALGQAHEFLVGQDVRMERQQNKINEAKSRVEMAKDFLRGKSIEYRMIEKLREKEWKNFVKEKAKREQKSMDDMTVMRFRRSEE